MASVVKIEPDLNRRVRICCQTAAYRTRKTVETGGHQRTPKQHRRRSAVDFVDAGGVRWTHSEALLTGRF